MRSIPFEFLLSSFLSVSLALSRNPPVQILSNQCWHEFPLSSVLLQTSYNGVDELVIPSEASTSSILGSTGQADFGPWSYPLVCTGVLQTLGSKLCVYTNASFGDGRGISIFTTPRIAAEFVTLPALQDPTALDGNGINTFSGSWYAEELPGKGVGMLARRNLKPKDRITAYTPALLAHLEDELPTMEREKYFRIAISQLPAATRDSYLQLATVYGKPQIRVQDIVKANTFQLHIGGQNHLAVFPETSRLNHDCSPNAQYYLDPALLTHFVHATRPIAKGEEITISYTSPLELTADRQLHLSQGFHFTCACSRCTSKSTDTTLSEIRDMQNALNDWSSTSKASPKLAEKMLQLYRKEGLEGFLDIPYGFAALAYNAVGDSERATKYAEKAVDAILMKDGPWTPNLRIWNEMLQDPKTHWSYRRRKR
ncbi:SET domain-containing protein [Zopfia rhizophila CBS 207.26]|uniref:SET domain-containing protein n=1 Tax=Zopfia rhizophila CBS 207.26 TaxID=1314779 RepID=A0A6A6E2R7_9PEZI|nr:SET domain-containing protein [Zopfia rhizophila CBS 207.26]